VEELKSVPDLRALLGVRSAEGGRPRLVWLVGMASHVTLLAVVTLRLAVVARLLAAVSTPAGHHKQWTHTLRPCKAGDGCGILHHLPTAQLFGQIWGCVCSRR
jgi:hypothetical protein